MRFSSLWNDYQLIDATDGKRLEAWKNIYFIRPDPQVIWHTPQTPQDLWDHADAVYYRHHDGGGHWEYRHKIPTDLTVSYNNLHFKIKPTDFKHMGLFPEHAVNWDFYQNAITAANRKIKVLNLFSYTGAATLACAASGATVCHVDAAKGMVAWARENAALSQLADKPIRWIVDDCEKFIKREIRRGQKYDAIIMDPPSYGRGPHGEIWKVETRLYDFLCLCKELLVKQPLFISLNSYTTGFSANTMGNLLKLIFKDLFSSFIIDEIGIPIARKHILLSCGATALALGKECFYDESPSTDNCI